MSTLCHCERDPDYEARARWEPTVTFDVSTTREPGEWQPEHLADLELDGPVEGLVVECQRCGWTEDLPALVEVGEIDWAERLLEILACGADPETDAWELLERIQSRLEGIVFIHASRPGAWMVSQSDRSTMHKLGTGETKEEAIRNAWQQVKEVAS